MYVDANGRAAKAYVLSSSASKTEEDATKDAALKSVYSPARFYCTPVPGTYVFRADFARVTTEREEDVKPTPAKFWTKPSPVVHVLAITGRHVREASPNSDRLGGYSIALSPKADRYGHFAAMPAEL